MNNILETIAPISIENLKQYFEDKTITFVIDYENSKLRGNKLLIYLSNLDIPCDIKFSNNDDISELVGEYLTCQNLVSVSSLESLVIQLLLEKRNIFPKTLFAMLEKHADKLQAWENILDSLPLYNIFTLNVDQYKEDIIKNSEHDDNTYPEICNFVNLLKWQSFYNYYETPPKKMKYYSKYFNDYVFSGNNLFHYWCNPNNLLYVMTGAIAEGLLDIKEYDESKNTSIAELKKIKAQAKDYATSF